MSKAERRETIGTVSIVSRHRVEAELRRMRKAVEGLPSDLRADVAELFAETVSPLDDQLASCHRSQ